MTKLAHLAVILFAEIAACSGKVALRHRPRRDAVHHYVLTMRYSRDDAPIVASVARTDQVWTIYYTQLGRFIDRRGAGSEVSLQIDSAQLQPSGADPDLSPMNGATILVFLDGRGQLQRTEPDTFPGLTHDMVLRLRAIAAAELGRIAGAIVWDHDRPVQVFAATERHDSRRAVCDADARHRRPDGGQRHRFVSARDSDDDPLAMKLAHLADLHPGFRQFDRQ